MDKIVWDLFTYITPVQKKEVRELERCAQKLAKSGCSLLFNGACLNENVLPNYSN